MTVDEEMEEGGKAILNFEFFIMNWLKSEFVFPANRN